MGQVVNIAVMAHNTTYHQTLKCTPTEIFHGRVPYNAVDLKFSNPLSLPRNAIDTQSLVDNLNSKFKETHANIIKAFHKYKAHYDRKAQASPLKVNDFAFLLNPKITSQSETLPFNAFKWEGPYKVVKVLSHSDYIIRNVGTFKAQCVYRMRLRPFVPLDHIEDVIDDANRHYSDPDATDHQAMFNDNLPELEQQASTSATGEVDTNEIETIDAQHGMIYYEHEQVYEVPPMSQPLPETVQSINTRQPEFQSLPEQTNSPLPHVEPENNVPVNDDAGSTASTSETPAPATRNNITRYSLRETPVPKIPCPRTTSKTCLSKFHAKEIRKPLTKISKVSPAPSIECSLHHHM